MHRLKAFGAITLLVLGLLGLLFLTLDVRAGQTEPTTRAVHATLCVNPGGTAGCYASIRDAVKAAEDSDTVRVAGGTYLDTVVLTKSLTLEGGWNADFTARDWDVYVTTIDAQRCGTVIQVRGKVSPTIEGLVITRGDSSGGPGFGGGINVYGDAADRGGLVTIRHNVITDNIACRLDTCQAQGGGIRIGISTAIIDNNTIANNVARVSGTGGAQGGGVMIGWAGRATLTGNVIVSNTAAYTTTHPTGAEGGGVYSYSGDAVLADNEIRGNVAAVDGAGRGGGVHAGGRLINNRIISNTASVNGDGYGGGVYAEYVLRFEDNVVRGNVASQNGDGTGGGIWAKYFSQAYRNTVESNTATRGGGIYYTDYSSPLVLRDNTIARNSATGTAGAPPDGGGGIASAADEVEIVNNRIVSNTADGAGGGLLFTGGTKYRFHDNRVINNTAMSGGGVAVYTATGTISNNHVISNLSLFGGGLYLWGSAQPLLDGNVVLSNTALGFYAAGGGILVNVDSGLVTMILNHVIARNTAGSGGPGGGVLCWQGDCVLMFNTIVDNDGGDYKEGVYLASAGGIHTVWNNIIAGHSTGVDLVAGAVALDYNDYYDNDLDVSGATWGPHHRSDAPQFVDRVGADYHLALTSPLVDQADPGVAPDHDFEGDQRPRGSGYDIGADEAYLARAFVSVDGGNDLLGSGTMAAPFASVTKGLSEVHTGGTVYVAQGRYTECITITRDVDLLGGYRESDWSRDIDGYVTTLDAQGTGPVVTIHGRDVEATVEGFTVTGGEAAYAGGLGGGVAIVDGAQATIRYNNITGNHALNAGGGLFAYAQEGLRIVIDSNRIHNNVAEGVFNPITRAAIQSPQQGPEPGGGVLVGGGALVVNNLVYDNSAAAGGDGIGLIHSDDGARVLHNSIVDNGDEHGVGIELGMHVGDSAIELYNNLIVGHGTAISGSQATWDHNGFFDNGALYRPGLTGGSHDVHGDPQFVDLAGGDFDIGPGSAGAGRGMDAGVTVDLDGAMRPAPAGSAPDMGAYEVAQRRVYLPLALK